MLKLTGIIIIFSSCSIMGLYLYHYTKYCYDFVCDMIDGFKSLRRDIEFSQERFCKALIKAAECSGLAKNIFYNIGQDIENFAEYINSADIDKKLKNICLSFFKQIGRSNLENELKLIDATIDKLTILKEEYKKVSENNGRLYAKSGVIIGLLFVILFF